VGSLTRIRGFDPREVLVGSVLDEVAVEGFFFDST
jgi:hypothetical protein